MKQDKENIKSEIFKISKELSQTELIEVLKFTKILKKYSKRNKKGISGRIRLSNDLNKLHSSEMLHLEEEFKNYKKLHPREK